jgi:hypothetical protein
VGVGRVTKGASPLIVTGGTIIFFLAEISCLSGVPGEQENIIKTGIKKWYSFARILCTKFTILCIFVSTFIIKERFLQYW